MAGEEVIGVTTARAAKVVGVSIKRLVAWEQNGLVRPRVHREMHSRHLRLYGLDELVEACVVRLLEDRQLSIRRIRRVVEAYRQRQQVRHPLRELRWGTVGNRIYVALDGVWMDGHRPGQGVITNAINIEEVRVEARRKATSRPAELVGRIEHRSATMGAKPLIAGTRTPVAAIHAYLRRGITTAEILEAFPHLTEADIEGVREAAG